MRIQLMAGNDERADVDDETYARFFYRDKLHPGLNGRDLNEIQVSTPKRRLHRSIDKETLWFIPEYFFSYLEVCSYCFFLFSLI